jgi:hypothetical protein
MTPKQRILKLVSERLKAAQIESMKAEYTLGWVRGEWTLRQTLHAQSTVAVRSFIEYDQETHNKYTAAAAVAASEAAQELKVWEDAMEMAVALLH